jgi:phosphate starvation-inducible membrane PsiE
MHHIPSLLMIISIAIALWQWALLPRPRSRPFVVVGIIIIAALIVEVIGLITNYFNINNNVPYNLFGLLEALLVIHFIGLLRPAWKWLLAAMASIIVSAFLINFRVMGSVSAGLAVEAILLNSFLLSVLLMATLWWLAQESAVPMHKVPMFWVLVGLLLYFAGIVPCIGGYEILFKQYEVGHRVFHIVQGLCIIRYLFTAYACRLARIGTGPVMVPK